MKSITILSLAVLLASCGKFSDGTSVWASGLWIAPWLTGLGSIACFVAAYVSSKSNSDQQVGVGGPNPRIEKNTGNVPITKLGLFWWGVALAVATIVIVIAVNADR